MDVRVTLNLNRKETIYEAMYGKRVAKNRSIDAVL